jgi:hypothetical protein
VLVPSGVDLIDQPVQRRDMAILDSPPFVRDDIREAVRLGQTEPWIGGHPYSMTGMSSPIRSGD